MTNNNEMIHYESNSFEDAVSDLAVACIRAKAESDKAHQDLLNKMQPLFEMRKNLYIKSKEIEEEQKKVKDALGQVDAELQGALQSAGMDDGSPIRAEGFRYSFVTERTGSVAVGKEVEAVRRAKELGLDGLVKVTIPKTALGKYEGDEMDGFIDISEYQKFKVIKDTSKKGGN